MGVKKGLQVMPEMYVLVSEVCGNKVSQSKCLKQQELLFTSINSGDHKFQITVLVRFFPSEGCGGESVPCLFPTFMWFTGNLWHFLTCVSVSKFPPFCKITSPTELGAHPLQYNLILIELIISATPSPQ